FFFAGHHEEARELIYDLEERLPFEDEMFPYGNVDTPGDGASVSGVVEVTGWAIDDRGVEEVEVLVDGETVGTAAYGLSRPDVAEDHGGLPNEPRFGYSLPLDTTDLGSGTHDIEVIARDAAGNASTLLPGLFSVTVEGP
ncbi:MAG: Ig-like domain-containing protein, partial [Actinomycetota bacterium]